VNLKLADRFKDSLISEIAGNKNFFKNFHQENLKNSSKALIKNRDKSLIETLYFGGGTPSLLSQKTLVEIFKTLRSNFNFSKNIEITFEVNPDDVSEEYYKMLLELGANRLSIGIQSFDNEMLKMMNRRHDKDQATASITYAIKAGFSNISIDFIYGLPGMNLNKWRETLSEAFSFPITHLSAYHLSIEEGTVFYKWTESGRIISSEEEESWRQFEILHEMAQLNGLEHYEISNFAKDEHYSKHNSNYWNGTAYLGLGPSAHSYDGTIRRWNVSSIEKYINNLNNSEKIFDFEELSLNDKMNEYFMTSLRTKRGIDFNYLQNTFGEESYKRVSGIIEKYSKSDHIKIEDEKAEMTLKGWFISDRIMAEMIL